MRKEWLAVFGIFVAGLACASGPDVASASQAKSGHGESWHVQSMDICRLQPTVRGLWQHHDYAASTAISEIMVAAIDGDIAAVRKGLQGLRPDQRARWRQTALSQAELGNHPDTVRALIADGADPNARAWIPPYTARAWEEGIQAMAQHAHTDALTDAMRKNAASMNQGMWLAPPLIHAAECNEAQVMTALLQSGASVHATWADPASSGDALLVSALRGNVAAARLLLDHGASTCHDDGIMARNAKRKQHKKVPAVASIARNNGMPPALVARLQCHAP